MLNFNFKEEYILEDDFVKMSPLEIKHEHHFAEFEKWKEILNE